MNLLLLNVLLAVAWMFMWGSFDSWTLVAGLVVAYLLIGLYTRSIHGVTYGKRLWKLAWFFCYFIKILVKANLQVAYEIITPRFNMTPRLLRYEVEGMTPIQITTLASAITLTPGTLSVDISDDNRFLYVHCMYAKDPFAAMKDLDELRERLMAEVFE
ncbi:MAG: Na+/H+ antiporter subunit E [Phycisphaera sp.]|nr:Na+/H+ antiporter subunit E [Phycisphaera sp.]